MKGKRRPSSSSILLPLLCMVALVPCIKSSLIFAGGRKKEEGGNKEISHSFPLLVSPSYTYKCARNSKRRRGGIFTPCVGRILGGLTQAFLHKQGKEIELSNLIPFSDIFCSLLRSLAKKFLFFFSKAVIFRYYNDIRMPQIKFIPL